MNENGVDRDCNILVSDTANEIVYHLEEMYNDYHINKQRNS